MKCLRPSPALSLSRHLRRAFVIAAGNGKWALLSAVAVALLGSGCLSVTVYQPQKGIHRPVVIEPAEHNFTPLRILFRCHADDEDLPTADAAKLCSTLAEDFRRQGAKVDTVVPSGKNYIEPEVFDGRKPHLVVEIESFIDHHYAYSFSAAASILTLTMIPSIEEWTFSQRVVVFGADGSVLAEDTFQERFVEYGGLGVWTANVLLNWLAREESEQISDEQAQRDFTNDFYGQLRQLAFNAKIRSETLGITPPTPSRRVVKEKVKAARERREGTATPEPAAGVVTGTISSTPDEAEAPADSQTPVSDTIEDVGTESPPAEEAPPTESPPEDTPSSDDPPREEPLTLPGELELPDTMSLLLSPTQTPIDDDESGTSETRQCQKRRA